MAMGIVFWGFILHQMNPPESNVTSTDSPLLQMPFPKMNLADAISGEPVTLTQASLSNAVVIILGDIGCSSNQVEVLKQWKEYQEVVDSTEIMVLYADVQQQLEFRLTDV